MALKNVIVTRLGINIQSLLTVVAVSALLPSPPVRLPQILTERFCPAFISWTFVLPLFPKIVNNKIYKITYYWGKKDEPWQKKKLTTKPILVFIFLIGKPVKIRLKCLLNSVKSQKVTFSLQPTAFRVC